MNSREVALRILYEIDQKGAFSNISLGKALTKSGLEQRDRALVTELVHGIIKYKLNIDYIIGSLSKIKFTKISPWILNILRIGMYQLKFMDKIPPSAAVNECVKLAKRYGHGASAGFVNAVLRKASLAEILPDEKDEVKYFSVKYSYPEWLVRKWLDEFGRDFTEKLLIEGNRTPKTDVRINLLRTNAESFSSKEYAQKSGFLPETFSINSPVENNPDFLSGMFTVQDAASQLVAHALEPKEGQRILDMCSSPGGKTTHIAELTHDRAEILAWDIYEHKLALVSEAAKRLGLASIKTELQDASSYMSGYDNSFDRVLVDAPCTGYGIIRRKPDIKWNRAEGDSESLSKLQLKILDCAAKYLKRGGILVYSTCTFGKEENVEVVERFLEKNKDFNLLAFDKAFPINDDGMGWIQLYPSPESDGFFISRFIKQA